jgi:hypothetical protein
MGSLGQHSPNFPPFSLNPGYHHAIVPGRLMTHPGDHRSLGPLLDGNSLRPGHGAAADWCGVICDGPCHPRGKISVIRMKAQEHNNRPVEIFNVLGLGLVTAASVGFLLLGKTLRGSLGFEVGTNALDGRCQCPHAS